MLIAPATEIPNRLTLPRSVKVPIRPVVISKPSITLRTLTLPIDPATANSIENICPTTGMVGAGSCGSVIGWKVGIPLRITWAFTFPRDVLADYLVVFDYAGIRSTGDDLRRLRRSSQSGVQIIQRADNRAGKRIKPIVAGQIAGPHIGAKIGDRHLRSVSRCVNSLDNCSAEERGVANAISTGRYRSDHAVAGCLDRCEEDAEPLLTDRDGPDIPRPEEFEAEDPAVAADGDLADRVNRCGYRRSNPAMLDKTNRLL